MRVATLLVFFNKYSQFTEKIASWKWKIGTITKETTYKNLRFETRLRPNITCYIMPCNGITARSIPQGLHESMQFYVPSLCLNPSQVLEEGTKQQFHCKALCNWQSLASGVFRGIDSCKLIFSILIAPVFSFVSNSIFFWVLEIIFWVLSTKIIVYWKKTVQYFLFRVWYIFVHNILPSFWQNRFLRVRMTHLSRLSVNRLIFGHIRNYGSEGHESLISIR